jgi:large subunit ribosomal protein L21
MYALVDIKGKQYKVEKGSLIKIDRMAEIEGESVVFDSVLMLSGEGKAQFGQPYLKGIKIEALVEKHGKEKKIIVYKYNKRKRYRKKQGHRKQYTLIKVRDITGVSERSKGPEKPSKPVETKASKPEAAPSKAVKAKPAETKASKPEAAPAKAVKAKPAETKASKPEAAPGKTGKTKESK